MIVFHLVLLKRALVMKEKEIVYFYILLKNKEWLGKSVSIGINFNTQNAMK